jgi:hypothetical protein
MDSPATPQRLSRGLRAAFLLHDRDAAFTDVVSTIGAIRSTTSSRRRDRRGRRTTWSASLARSDVSASIT